MPHSRTQTGRRTSAASWLSSAAATAVLCAASPQLQAVVVRHDRPVSEAAARGRGVAAAGRVLPDGGCTLIAPTWAITAAHVAARLGPDARVEFDGVAYPVARVVIHPEGRGPDGAPPEIDLALIELARPAQRVTPVPLYRDRDELGQMVVIVGHGDYGHAGAPLQRADGTRRAVTNIVDDAGPRRLFVTFDAPPAGTPLEGVGAPGDSGGPALIERQGRVMLAGVSSASMNGRPGSYGLVDVYTRVSSHLAWIEATLGR